MFQDQNEASLYFNHTVPLWKKLGLAGNLEIAMNSGYRGNQSYYYLLNGSAQNQKVQGFSLLTTENTLFHQSAVDIRLFSS